MIINPISKSTKGLTPEIIVTAPSGSTLDIMQNSVVLQTYTLGSSETSHTFAVKSVGSYVVRGTKSSYTESRTVVIDSIGQYSVSFYLDGKLRLYWYGDECESVTGGWVYTPSTLQTSYNAYAVTQNTINIASYNTISVICTYTNNRYYGQLTDSIIPEQKEYAFENKRLAFDGTVNTISSFRTTEAGTRTWTLPKNLGSKHIAIGDGTNNNYSKYYIKNTGSNIEIYDNSGSGEYARISAVWLE